MIAEAVVVGKFVEYISLKEILYLEVERFNVRCQQDQFRFDSSVIPINVERMCINRDFLKKMNKETVIGIRGRIINGHNGIEIEGQEITYIGETYFWESKELMFAGTMMNEDSMYKIYDIKAKYGE